MKQPSLHIRDNKDGTMTVRTMFQVEAEPLTVATGHYLSACHLYLENRWPLNRYQKSGWSANASEAVFHFNQI